jgi:hypothetical protein
MALEKRISELTAKVGAIEDTDLMVISDYNGATYDTKKVTGAQIKPFKTYLASITQSGTSAPTLIYGYSELSSTITFGYRAPGSYKITASTAEFTANKTFIQISNGESGGGIILEAYRSSATEIYIYVSSSNTLTYADGLLNNCQIEIKIIK